MRGVLAFVVCLGLLVACSDSSGPTDPGDPGTEDPIEDPTQDPNEDPDTDPGEDPGEDPDDDPIVVAGTWSYSTATLTDAASGETCEIENVTMVLTRDGDALSGTAKGLLSCDLGEWDRDAAVQGSVDGTDLTFMFSDLDSQARRAEVVHEGAIDGDTMSGTATLHYEDSQQTFELTGDWTATRDR